MDSMDSFEFWLRRMEGKVERMSYRPSTREEASDLLDVTKVNSKDSEKIYKFEKFRKRLKNPSVKKKIRRISKRFGKEIRIE